MLKVQEHSSSSYAPRTYLNASSADFTVAFATDFTTAGERLTHKAAGSNYLAVSLVDYANKPKQAAKLLYDALKAADAHTLNIAGNGIYTLHAAGWTQAKINTFVHAVLSKLCQHWTLTHVVSGGQTGVDIAGIVAARALNINATATLPRGYIQRGSDKKDVSQSVKVIRAQIKLGVSQIKAESRISVK